MNEHKATLYLIQGAIRELPAETQEQVNGMAEKIRELIANSNGTGQLAVALIGAELAASDE